MQGAEEAARSMNLTLNAFLLGSLAWLLYECSGQHRFAVSQTYSGRTMEELQVLGSFSTSLPLAFNFSVSSSLPVACHHVMLETQRLLASDMTLTYVLEELFTTVAWELNDVRPMARPPETKQQSTHFKLKFPLCFMVNQYVDGFTVSVRYHGACYDAAGVDSFVDKWMKTVGAGS